jgi:hypothetical protein
MLKFATLAGIAVAAAMTMASPAHAGIFPGFCQIFSCDRPPTSAPEIDPSMLSGAFTVLVGGGLMLAERFRRR